MNNQEFVELSTLAREDGRRLFEVTETLHRLGLIGPLLILLVGVIGGFAAISNVGLGAGLFVFTIAGFISWVLYLGLVLITSLSKVFVHSMFCMLGTLESMNKSNNNDS
jgi:uncharacterized membrane protein